MNVDIKKVIDACTETCGYDVEINASIRDKYVDYEISWLDGGNSIGASIAIGSTYASEILISTFKQKHEEYFS